MIHRETDIIALFEAALQDTPVIENLQEIGTVIKVGDNVCKVYGLTNAVFGEVVLFERGGTGVVMGLDEDYVSVVCLESNQAVIELDTVKRTHEVFKVPVGKELLGRIVNVQGLPLDAKGPITTNESYPIERPAKGIAEREPVYQPLNTGIVAIDCLIPIGKGQRELIIGNRGTGKTALALTAILQQKDKNVICIYVSIGNKQATTARIIHELEIHGAMEYVIVVNADAKESALNQFLAPYAGCSIGEYFMEQGRDVLIIYDDLSAHAIAYRELSLLLRRPPGREAYPGDIFYIHSRLLERAAKLSTAQGGGSLTALPIIQTQGDDISAYIPTNLISITDGQIFLDTNLFNSGIRPAVKIGLSVSRVGGAAQTKAIKKVAGSLRLELAQYDELQAFAQFGSELDKSSQRVLERGKRAIEILKQEEQEGYSFAEQVLFLFLLKEDHLDDRPLSDIKPFVTQFASYFKSVYSDSYNLLTTSEDLPEDVVETIQQAVTEFRVIFPQNFM